MSIELVVDPDDDGESDASFDLAPNHAWRAFAAWAGALGDDFADLAALANHGVASDAEAVVDQLATALDVDDLDDAVEAVGDRLYELIESLGTDDVLLVVGD